MKAEKITKKKVIAAIEDSAGIMSVIAKRAGCCGWTISRKLKKYPELIELIKNEKDKILDLAETQIIKKIKGGDNTMIIFYLKTKGKERGYVERVEQKVDLEVSKVPSLNINLNK